MWICVGAHSRLARSSLHPHAVYMPPHINTTSVGIISSPMDGLVLVPNKREKHTNKEVYQSKMTKTDLPKRGAVRTPNLFSFAPSDMPGAARAAHRQAWRQPEAARASDDRRRLRESRLVQHLRPLQSALRALLKGLETRAWALFLHSPPPIGRPAK
jgi:hypothetical protein